MEPMIEIVCDNCERTFTVDPREAGGKVACPDCGDINRVPEASPVTGRAGDDGPERELSIVRPAMFGAHPFRYLSILLLFAGGATLALAARFSESVWPWLAWPGLLISLAAMIWFSHWWLSTHWWVKLIISNKRTVRHEGIIRRHTTEVLHDHVRSVDISQNFVQRIMKVGRIGIDSAGQEDIEIQVSDIPRPYEVKKLIDQHRKM